tara:strand:- start:39 stop:221 length:183 start_codon:yes stop_codon:yes gene_type:complete
MTKKNNTTVNEGFKIMADMAWQLINRIESYDAVQAHCYRKDWSKVRARFNLDGSLKKEIV